MKTKILLLFILVPLSKFYSQRIDFQKEITDITKEFKDSNSKLMKLEADFEELKKSMTPYSEIPNTLEKKQLEIKKIRKETDSIYELAKSYKTIIETNKIKEVSSDFFSEMNNYKKVSMPSNDTSKKDESYLYFGPDRLVKEVDLETNKTKIPFLEELFNMKSEAYLGDFKVSQKGQLINIYNRRCHNCIRKIKLQEKGNKRQENVKETSQNNDTRDISNLDGRKLKLEKILLSIYEGAIKEVYVTLKDDRGVELLYENKFPISLMRFSSIAPKTALIYKTSVSHNKEEVVDNSYIDTEIKFSDVLMYVPNPGDNYVPDDLTLEFPQEKETDHTNVTYKVRQDTSLKNVLELRAYTDFLGLFNNSDNGLVQLEGRANFFVNPFNITNSRWFILKKITPYVNFSRLDNDRKYINMIYDGESKYKMDYLDKNNPNNNQDIRLETIEKAYLDMGFRAYLVSYAFSKESPFSASLYVPIRFLISNASIGDVSNPIKKFELKTFGLGGGFNLEFKKFNNFILNYSLEYTEFKSKEFNDIENFISPNAFWTLTNEAEVSYFPGKQKNQSAFVRFRIVTNSERNIHDSFYQFHFGYRFTIPLSTLKK